MNFKRIMVVFVLMLLTAGSGTVLATGLEDQPTQSPQNYLDTAESIDSQSTPYEIASNSDENYRLCVDTAKLDEETDQSTGLDASGLETERIDTDAVPVDRKFNVTYAEWKALHPGWENSPEFSTGCYKVFKDWLAEHPDRTEDEHNVALNVFMDSWVEEYGNNFTKDDLYKRDIFARELASDYYQVWDVQGAVEAAKFQQIVDIINAKRAEYATASRPYLSEPLIFDQTLVKSALARAAECNVAFFFNLDFDPEDRPGGKYRDPFVWYGSENVELISAGSSVEEIADKLFSDTFAFSALNYEETKYIGIAQFGDIWVAVAGREPSSISPKPVTNEFLDSISSSACEAEVIINPSMTSATVKSGYLEKSKIDIGETITLKPYLNTQSLYDHYAKNMVRVNSTAFIWNCSNPKIASVNSKGVVTGLSAGNAMITGTINGQSVSYNISVSSIGAVPSAPLEDYLVKYRTHVQNIGWQDYVADGTMSGTEGQNLRLEGISIDIDPSIGGWIEYQTHVENIGWQTFVSNGTVAGTSGRSLRLEAINITLIGAVERKYDVYYRTHVQNLGWLGWAKNDQYSGSTGFGYRLEGIEIKLVEKGGPAPGSTKNAFVSKDPGYSVVVNDR